MLIENNIEDEGDKIGFRELMGLRIPMFFGVFSKEKKHEMNYDNLWKQTFYCLFLKNILLFVNTEYVPSNIVQVILYGVEQNIQHTRWLHKYL